MNRLMWASAMLLCSQLGMGNPTACTVGVFSPVPSCQSRLGCPFFAHLTLTGTGPFTGTVQYTWPGGSCSANETSALNGRVFVCEAVFSQLSNPLTASFQGSNGFANVNCNTTFNALPGLVLATVVQSPSPNRYRAPFQLAVSFNSSYAGTGVVEVPALAVSAPIANNSATLSFPGTNSVTSLALRVRDGNVQFGPNNEQTFNQSLSPALVRGSFSFGATMIVSRVEVQAPSVGFDFFLGGGLSHTFNGQTIVPSRQSSAGNVLTSEFDFPGGVPAAASLSAQISSGYYAFEVPAVERRFANGFE